MDFEEHYAEFKERQKRIAEAMDARENAFWRGVFFVLAISVCWIIALLWIVKA